jgi:hypothetical protein
MRNRGHDAKNALKTTSLLWACTFLSLCMESVMSAVLSRAQVSWPACDTKWWICELMGLEGNVTEHNVRKNMFLC